MLNLYLYYSQAASLTKRKNVIHDIGLTESFISSEISTEKNSFLPSNKSCKSPSVMCRRTHSEQNVLLCPWGCISPRLSCAMLSPLPDLSAVMVLRAALGLPQPRTGWESGSAHARVPAAVTAPEVLLYFLANTPSSNFLLLHSHKVWRNERSAV